VNWYADTYKRWQRSRGFLWLAATLSLLFYALTYIGLGLPLIDSFLRVTSLITIVTAPTLAGTLLGFEAARLRRPSRS
jgi:hypothetical protein